MLWWLEKSELGPRSPSHSDSPEIEDSEILANARLLPLHAKANEMLEKLKTLVQKSDQGQMDSDPALMAEIDRLTKCLWKTAGCVNVDSEAHQPDDKGDGDNVVSPLSGRTSTHSDARVSEFSSPRGLEPDGHDDPNVFHEHNVFAKGELKSIDGCKPRLCGLETLQIDGKDDNSGARNAANSEQNNFVKTGKDLELEQMMHQTTSPDDRMFRPLSVKVEDARQAMISSPFLGKSLGDSAHHARSITPNSVSSSPEFTSPNYEGSSARRRKISFNEYREKLKSSVSPHDSNKQTTKTLSDKIKEEKEKLGSSGQETNIKLEPLSQFPPMPPPPPSDPPPPPPPPPPPHPSPHAQVNLQHSQSAEAFLPPPPPPPPQKLSLNERINEMLGVKNEKKEGKDIYDHKGHIPAASNDPRCRNQQGRITRYSYVKTEKREIRFTSTQATMQPLGCWVKTAQPVNSAVVFNPVTRQFILQQPRMPAPTFVYSKYQARPAYVVPSKGMAYKAQDLAVLHST